MDQSFIGTLSELADTLANKLMLSGMSLMPLDVLTAIKTETSFYMGYADLDAHVNAVPAVVHDELQLTYSEWAVIEPVVRANCDLVQAYRVEASRSIGAESFGLSVSEAQQNYMLVRDNFAKNAFVSPPYSLNFDEV